MDNIYIDLDETYTLVPKKQLDQIIKHLSEEDQVKCKKIESVGFYACDCTREQYNDLPELKVEI